MLLTVLREPESARRATTLLLLIAMTAVSLAIAVSAAVAPLTAGMVRAPGAVTAEFR